jgi:hypothetical protein
MVVVDSPDSITMILNNAAQCLVVFHIMIGTLIFSGCQFLRMTDAVPLIWRFSISALICRLINIYELRGMSSTLDIKYKSSSGRRSPSKGDGVQLDRAVVSRPYPPSVGPGVGATTLAAGAIRHSI